MYKSYAYLAGADAVSLQGQGAHGLGSRNAAHSPLKNVTLSLGLLCPWVLKDYLTLCRSYVLPSGSLHPENVG